MTAAMTVAATINQGMASPATASPVTASHASNAAMPCMIRVPPATMRQETRPRVNLHHANRPPENPLHASLRRAKADALTAASGSNNGAHQRPSVDPQPSKRMYRRAFRPSSPRPCVLFPRSSR